jgi:nucleotide-binding universal stress UspA family protein
MYTRILVPLDGSDLAARALGPAEALSKALDTPLAVAGWASELTLDKLGAQIEHNLAERGLTGVDRLVSTTGRTVAEEVAQLVEEEPGTLVCMSSIGRSHTGALLGSVAEGILRESMVPVLLIGPGMTDGTFAIGGKMVVPVDGSSTAEAAISLAEAWAIVMHYDPVVVAVAEPGTPERLARAAATGADPGLESAYPHRVARAMEQQLGREVDFEVLHGDPADAIVRYTTDLGATMVVMATHGETGLRRFVAGSVTMATVHQAPCPVLVVRPPHLR